MTRQYQDPWDRHGGGYQPRPHDAEETPSAGQADPPLPDQEGTAQ